ncbi:integrase, catalytic region [Methylorubrum populi]|uniref:Integrase, catalytic region n=1 Tax=Methylorubrum populi TaxID=223967 RepID=A0A160PKP7_9HYPH|nr:hypothetical protein [Methylorubrum populi]BAU92791.1 integrase, catalytic region [Methylorubrum populi]
MEQAQSECCTLAGSGRTRHTDRGLQHVNTNHTERRAEVFIELYVGSFGGSCDNAVTKRVAGLLQARAIHRPNP